MDSCKGLWETASLQEDRCDQDDRCDPAARATCSVVPFARRATEGLPDPSWAPGRQAGGPKRGAVATDGPSGLHLGPGAWVLTVKSMAEAGLEAGAGVGGRGPKRPLFHSVELFPKR